MEETQDGDVRHIGYYIPLSGTQVFVVNAVPADSQVWSDFERVLATIRFKP